MMMAAEQCVIIALSVRCLLVAHNEFARSAEHRGRYLSHFSQTRRLPQ